MQNKQYQTIIFQVNSLADINSLGILLQSTKEESSIFVLGRNLHNEKGFITFSIFDILASLLPLGINYLNTIIIPRKTKIEEFRDNILYVLWFCRDKQKVTFYKDSIREKHIWKDVEWGKRAKNYNPKGKDPGNVWIPTDDDGKANIIKHIFYADTEIVNRCMMATTRAGDEVFIRYIDLAIDQSDLLPTRQVTLYHEDSVSNLVYAKPINQFNTRKTNEQSMVIYKSSETMTEIGNNSIDLMITSPPYWDLKDYLKSGQIGAESYDTYLSRIKTVLTETYRVLSDQASMWINVNMRIKKGKVIPIPIDLVKICNAIGFKFKDIVIWHKSSGIPTHKKNISDHFEYFLWFTKTESFIFNTDAIKGINDYMNDDLNYGFTWNINRKAGSVGKDFIHPAIFPTELIVRIIEICSNPGSIILDPFLGSGTTLVAAIKNMRACIGYEFNESFDNLIRYRLAEQNIDSKSIIFIGGQSNSVERDLIFRNN